MVGVSVIVGVSVMVPVGVAVAVAVSVPTVMLGVALGVPVLVGVAVVLAVAVGRSVCAPHPPAQSSLTDSRCMHPADWHTAVQLSSPSEMTMVWRSTQNPPVPQEPPKQAQHMAATRDGAARNPHSTSALSRVAHPQTGGAVRRADGGVLSISPPRTMVPTADHPRLAAGAGLYRTKDVVCD